VPLRDFTTTRATARSRRHPLRILDPEVARWTPGLAA
jgi:hypothetical protein